MNIFGILKLENPISIGRRNARLTQIDALRGIAALSVVYLHYSYSFKDLAHTGKYGYLGVHIFFIISGFVLPYSLFHSNYYLGYYWQFLKKRIIRIDPPYLLAALLAIGLPALNGRNILSWQASLAHLGYLNDILNLPWASGVFWTLAIEFQFYLFLGLTYKGYLEKSHVVSLLFILGTIACAFIFRNRSLLPYWFTFFSLGALIFRRMVFGMPRFLFAFGVLCLVVSTLFLFGIPEAVTSILVTGFILYVKINQVNIFSKALIALGTISYSLYLIHIEVSKIARRLMVANLAEYLQLAIWLSLALISATVFYYFIERPFKLRSSRVWFRSKSNRNTIKTVNLQIDEG